MDKEIAIALLDGAEATTKTWEVADDSVHKTWGILVSGHEIYWVASGRMPPTRPEAALIAAAPQLARWGIELTEEIDRLRDEAAGLRFKEIELKAELASTWALVDETEAKAAAAQAELADTRAELASFRALVAQVPQALVESIPNLVALLAKTPEGHDDNPCAVGCNDTLEVSSEIQRAT